MKEVIPLSWWKEFLNHNKGLRHDEGSFIMTKKLLQFCYVLLLLASSYLPFARSTTFSLVLRLGCAWCWKACSILYKIMVGASFTIGTLDIPQIYLFLAAQIDVLSLNFHQNAKLFNQKSVRTQLGEAWVFWYE